VTDRVIYVDDQVTVLDGCVQTLDAVKPTPANAFAGGLAGLLDRIAPRFGGEGVVALGAGAVTALGLPARPIEGPRGRDDHGVQLVDEHTASAVVAELARGGWSCNRVSDWSTVYGGGRPKLHVLNTRLVDSATFPLWSTQPLDLVARLRLWHELTGYAWRLSPAASGLAVMTGLDRARVDRVVARQRPASQEDKARRRVETTWKAAGLDAPDGAYEDDFRRRYWARTPPAEELQPFAHCFDGIRAYMAAALLCEVSPWPLKHTGRIRFNRRLAGWWLVELAPWNDPRMPDPAGYVDLVDGSDRRRLVRWITTPTLILLEELTAEGVYGGVRIIDSYTGPARDYPLREYAQRMDDAYQFSVRVDGKRRAVDYPLVGADDVAAIESAVKMVGHKTYGALDSATNWAYRPHWWYSILALSRANLWRKLWAVGKNTGQWPLWVEVDAVWYGSTCEDPQEAATVLQFPGPSGPKGIVLDMEGKQFGRFTPKGTRRLRRPRTVAA